MSEREPEDRRSSKASQRVNRPPTYVEHYSGLMTAEEKLLGNIFGDYPSLDELSQRTPESFAQMLEQQAAERKARMAARVGEPADTTMTELELSQKEIELFGTLRERTDRTLSMLDPREAQVLRLRFGLGDGMTRTQAKVAKEIARSASTVGRIERRALRNLRDLPKE